MNQFGLDSQLQTALGQRRSGHRPTRQRTAAADSRSLSRTRKQTSPVFQETPIYTRLVVEQGDVPAQVRGEAQRVLRDLERVMPPPAVQSQTAPSFRPGDFSS
ncbi:hypothetical protein [Streptomyces sp. NPDC018352]|uniref:hypothetical protein n=1 Tax=Streptomyces sp. NPDC018352 TaxID=3157194 RepID=UPI0033E5CBEE